MPFLGYADPGSDRICEASWKDDERLVQRSWRLNGDGNRYAALLVALVGEDPCRDSLDQLHHEFELRHELDVAWAARPLELVRDGARVTLVLEDPGGEPLQRLLDAPLETGRFLELAIAMTVAV